MGIRKRVIVGLLALASWTGLAQAQATADAAHAQVQAEIERAYHAALVQFAANEASAAEPVEVAVARCEFIGRYVDGEYGPYVEAASDDFQACMEDLEKRFPTDPRTVLYRLESGWEDALFANPTPVLDQAKRWQPAQRAKLYALLAARKSLRQGEFAVEAARLGDTSELAMAVEKLAAQKRFDEAAKLLRDAPIDDVPWRASQRVTAALALPDRQAALVEAQRHRARNVGIADDALARAWLRAGNSKEAARILGKPLANDGMHAVRFEVAYANHDWPAAIATIDVDRDMMESLQRFGMLATAAPSTLVQGQMPLLLVMVLMMAGALAVLPGLLLWPVHYRGLARRLQHRMSQARLPRVTLWHAWYGAALALVVPTVLSLFLAPEMLEGKKDGVLPVMLWSTLLSLALLLPIIGVFGKRVLLGDAAMWRATWKSILGYWGLLLLIVFTLNVVFGLIGADTSTEQVKMVAALAERAKTPGVVLLTLTVVALIGPMFEELVFRGLLLNGFARHISFGWSNAIQAFLFACMHLDPPRFLFYFAMGLFGGWLVRRTGSIAPAIALHVLNNALAIGLLILAT